MSIDLTAITNCAPASRVDSDEIANSWGQASTRHWVRAFSFLRSYRFHCSVALHLVIFLAVYALAFQLRFDFSLPNEMVRLLWSTLPWVALVKLTLFYLTRNFQGTWRYFSIADVPPLLVAATASMLIVGGMNYFFIDQDQIPRSVLLGDWLLTVAVVGATRSAWRLTREQFVPLLNGHGSRRALIIGSAQSASTVARYLQAHPDLEYRAVGLLVTDPLDCGLRIGGVSVVGGIERIAEVAEAYNVNDILVVSGSVTGRLLRNLVDECQHAGIHLKIIPQMADLLNGHQALQLREVNIDDLLRREPVNLDDDSIGSLLAGRTIMVTGAGGSIGSEICRQVLRFNPKTLLLVERAENSLFLIERDLASHNKNSAVIPCIADVLELNRMRQLFIDFRPEVVFHAAAHKHVPMMEANPAEAIKNNVLGTKRMADLSNEFGVETFVFISTDKAVNPISVMGATKQIAERYVHAMAEQSSTRFMSVRFGNVLGSNGSVVPLFQEQIRGGGPITITHPDMTRFFMTIPEASQLVLQAAAMGKGGEIFVLDMGEPVRIVDLALDMVKLSGLQPDDIEIRFTGLRPGEKLAEELHTASEETFQTRHRKIMAVFRPSHEMRDVRKTIIHLYRTARMNPQEARRLLMASVRGDVHPVQASPQSATGRLAHVRSPVNA